MAIDEQNMPPSSIRRTTCNVSSIRWTAVSAVLFLLVHPSPSTEACAATSGRSITTASSSSSASCSDHSYNSKTASSASRTEPELLSSLYPDFWDLALADFFLFWSSYSECSYEAIAVNANNQLGKTFDFDLASLRGGVGGGSFFGLGGLSARGGATTDSETDRAATSVLEPDVSSSTPKENVTDIVPDVVVPELKKTAAENILNVTHSNISASPLAEESQTPLSSSKTEETSLSTPTITKPSTQEPFSQKKPPAPPKAYSLFQIGDGHEDDPDGIPVRYLHMHQNDRTLAKQALQDTLQWRLEHSIDEILFEPQPKYNVCKAIFPHFFVGRDRAGNVVFLQRPGLMDLELAAQNNVSSEDLLRHYIYVNEYLWQILEADSPKGKMTSILDMTGIRLGLMKRRDFVGFGKHFIATMDAHFPQRAHKTLVLNAPKWFHVIYKIVSPLLRETTKSKIGIYSKGKKQDEAMKEYLGDAAKAVPESFWTKEAWKELQGEQEAGGNDADANAGEREIPLSEFEQRLKSYTLARLEEAGMEMQTIV